MWGVAETVGGVWEWPRWVRISVSSVMLLGSEEKGASGGCGVVVGLEALFGGLEELVGFGEIELLVALEELAVGPGPFGSGFEELPVGFGEPKVGVDIATS